MKTPTETMAEENVARGAAWLDVEQPDWLNRVDLDRLYMSSSVDCIAGQVFAHRTEGSSTCSCCTNTGYTVACVLLDDEDDADYGFVEIGGGQEVHHAWVALVTERRTAVPA